MHANLDLTFAAQRFQGFVSAMQEAGLRVESELLSEAGFLRRSAYAAMNRFLSLSDRPTAVIVDNNQAGVGAIRALAEAGLCLGRDCSLIIYDGLPEDTLLDQQNVTSIEQPTPDQVGHKLAELMLGVMQGLPNSQLQVLWKPLLHPGTSDGPAPH